MALRTPAERHDECDGDVKSTIWVNSQSWPFFRQIRSVDSDLRYRSIVIVITSTGCLRCQNHCVLRGRKRYQEAIQLSGDKHQPPRLLAHDIVNKLSTIISFGELLVEKAVQHTECVNRVTSMHELAASAAKQLIDHQCELSVLIRITKPATSLFASGLRLDLRFCGSGGLTCQ